MEQTKDKVAVVTGAARGIGRAIALQLAQLGCHVAFNYLKSDADAKSLESEIGKLGVKCQASRVDIKNFAEVKKWIEQTRISFNGLDILINNAGIIIDKALMFMTEDDWRQVVDTNLNGMFNATRSSIVGFMKQKSGSIITLRGPTI